MRLFGFKKLAVIAALVLSCFALSGCGASLTVYDYIENGERHNVYRIEIDRATVDRMEATAATNTDGKKYTVPEYFYELFTIYGYKLESALLTPEKYDARFVKSFKNGETPELYSTGTAPEFDYSAVDNPFIRDITATADNPFNGIRESYDAVAPDTSGRLIQQLKNGIVSRVNGEPVVIFPAVQDAFPYVDGAALDGLLLNYVIGASDRTDSNGRPTDNGAIVFSRYFDTTDTDIVLGYKRPVPVGWYITAILVGGAVVAAILFFTRTKKQKPTLLDRFPYNPEEYRDYESHLPANRK